MATLRARLFRHVYLAWPGLAGLGLAARSAGLLALDWVRAGGSPTRSGLVGGRTCARCGIEARVPGVSLAADGRCVECRASAPPAGVALPGGRGAITLARISEPEVRAALTPVGMAASTRWSRSPAARTAW
ncbi:MAG: hypothetical protein IPK07_21835 [Deltaproteobacteria bacterium]|nr:hypothetical protein [Deltaproteobacteria bacterium]